MNDLEVKLWVDELVDGGLLPVSPLLAALGCPQQVAGEILGVCDRTIARWLQRGLTWAQADVLAVTAGYHPASIWGDDWWRSAQDTRAL